MASLSEIASLLSLPEPPGASAVSITGIAPLSEAGPTELSLLATEAYLPQLATTKAAALLVQRKLTLPPEWRRPVLFVDDVELAVARVLPLFAPPVPRPAVGAHPTAQISELATIGPDAAIGPFVVIGPRVRLGSHCVLHAGVYLGDDVTLGDDCELFPHVVVRERIQIGNRVVIHAGSVLGSDGFGYRWDGTRHAKVPQIGNVIIEDDVEIGSCVCIDRAKFSVTRIGRGTKIDNLVQIGHNAQTGPHCILVGQSGLAGSVHLGAGVLIGGQTAVRDHIRMGDGAMAAACSGVAEDVAPKGIVSGVPALPHRQHLREQTALRRLPHLLTQFRKLQEEVEALKKASLQPPDSAQTNSR
jgi:UDP-3-O-[3-hydroxymyristoyl] glucosamine N-acyltransferase